MSYYLLARGDGSTPESYNVSRTFAYIWGIYPGVSAEFTYIWTVYSRITAVFTYKWNIWLYVSREFTYIWKVWYAIQREFTYIWKVFDTSASIGGKIKHHFRANAVINRFYRKFRDG